MEWPVTIEVKVPWGDIDGAGHVNNARYFTYMESARVEAYFRAKGHAGIGRLDEFDIILARATCDFRAQASMGDALLVSVRPSRVGRTSFDLRYEVRQKRDGTLVAEGESVQVCFDYATQEKRPVPDALRKALDAGL